LHRSEELRHRRAAEQVARAGKTKPRSIGKEGTAPIGGILPASGANDQLARSGRRSAHRVSVIGAPRPIDPATPDGQGRGGGQQMGATEAGMVRQNPRRRSGSGCSRDRGTASMTPARGPVRCCGLTDRNPPQATPLQRRWSGGFLRGLEPSDMDDRTQTGYPTGVLWKLVVAGCREKALPGVKPGRNEGHQPP
jgi:hypothetical protein